MEDSSFEEMARDYECLLVYMDNIPDSIWFKDVNNRFVKVNRTKANHNNTSPDKMIGKTDFDFFPLSIANIFFNDEEAVKQTGKPIKSKVEKVIRKNGEEVWVSVTKIPWFDNNGCIIGTIGVSHDVTRIKSEEESKLFDMRLRDVLYGLLEISLRELTLEEQLNDAIEKVLSIPWLPLSPKGGIFLVDDDTDKLILKAQKNLNPSLLYICATVPYGHCLCGLAAQTKEIVFAAHVDDRHDNSYDGMPAHGHYCVPILSDSKLLGVLVLYVSDAHTSTTEEKGFLTAIANALSGIIERKKNAEKICKSHQIQDVLNSILKISMRPITLVEQLERVLELILSIPWLSLESKGSMFLVEDKQDVLIMKAQRGLAPQLLTECAQLPFGKCLCGQAAATREMVFAQCLDDRHDVRYDGMKPHGHYCVPIVSGREVLGVLNMYVREGYKRNTKEEEFLHSVANTLAGTIKRKQVEDTLKFMATYDTLTGIHNRTMFFDRLNHSVNMARRYNHKLGVLFLDLDGFKSINDKLGHNTGDLLLRDTAFRLKQCVRESDTVARMGGDEFTVLLTRISEEDDLTSIAHKIITMLNQPFSINGKHCRVGVSIGISIFPTDGDTLEELVKNADTAMYRVKESGKNAYLIYSQLA